MIEQVNPTFAGNFRCSTFQYRLKARFFLVLLFMVLLPGGAAAQNKTAEGDGSSEHRYQGEFTINLQGRTVTDPRTQTSLPIAEVKVQWAMWVLMGQPVKTFVANYSLQNAGMITTSGVASCWNGEVTVDKGRQTFWIQTSGTEKKPLGEIFSTSVFRAWFISKDPKQAALSSLLNKNHKVFIDFKPDSMVPASLGFGISAPGSPEWDQLFQRSSFGDSVYLTAAEAKEVMRRGLKLQGIELIEPHLNVSTALARHNQQVRIDCEEERKAKTNVQPDDKSPSLTDKLNARLAGEQVKSESSVANEKAKPDSPITNENPQSSDKLSSLTDRLNARLVEAGAKSGSSTSNDSGKDVTHKAENKNSKRGEATDSGLEPFCTLEQLYNSVTRFTHEKCDKWGYKDRAGNVVIEPQFDSVREFHFGYAVVEKGYRTYFLIDTTGKTVLGRSFDGMKNLGEFGLLAVKKNRRAEVWSYIDLNGNTVMDTDYVEAYPFVNGYARVVHRGVGKNTEYLNRDFKMIAGPFYSGKDFSRQGLAVVKTSQVNRFGGHEEYRYLKKDGSFMGSYVNAYSFNESGFAPVARRKGHDEEAWGIIDIQGKVIVPLDYREALIKYLDTGEVEFEVLIDSVDDEVYVQRFNTQGEAVSGKERRE
ncbi:WG repeat-containing protein [Methylophaga sp.]|uniref:WG repeat-containing protein n=1 Tax=Methylophaga sp. TaxID=2024840 RepID=UPI00272265F6|nr:WG repeat-containing protein [Methylophaga sp.]MDO8826959.1 WG repeat-containing protein [Methylophaga sp.]